MLDFLNANTETIATLLACLSSFLFAIALVNLYYARKLDKKVKELNQLIAVATGDIDRLKVK